MKITLIGTGNIGSSIVRGLAQGSMLSAADITCTDLLPENLERIKKVNPDFQTTQDNREAVKEADYIIIAVKPWRVECTLAEICPIIDFSKQAIISIAAGVSFEQLLSFIPKNTKKVHPTLFRVIPNTAISVMSSMTFVAAHNASQEQTEIVMKMFDELGNAMLIEERLMSAGTALASSGIAFALRYIRAAIEGGVELGFYPQEAQEIVTHTVKGAVDLLIANKTNPEAEIDKVTTPGGITIKGLNEMELSGFTSSVIRGLKASK